MRIKCSYEEAKELKACKPGTKLRILSFHMNGRDRNFWLSNAGQRYKKYIEKYGCYIVKRRVERSSFSLNKGFTGGIETRYIELSPQKHDDRIGWMPIKKARVVLWKEGDPEYAIYTY